MNGQRPATNIEVGGNFVGDVTFGNKTTTTHINDSSQSRPSLAEVIDEVERLLEEFEDRNAAATESDQVTYVNLVAKPELKQRAVGALKAGGEAAIDELVLENKYLKVVKAILMGWWKP